MRSKLNFKEKKDRKLSIKKLKLFIELLRKMIFKQFITWTGSYKINKKSKKNGIKNTR